MQHRLAGAPEPRRIGTEYGPEHHKTASGPLGLITMPTRWDHGVPLLLTEPDGNGSTPALPQGGLRTGRPVGGLVCACCLRVYLLLEGFPRGKRGDLFGGNGDGVACPRVASCACLTLTEPETAKASQVHPLLRLQRSHNSRQEPGDHGFRLVFRQWHGGGDLSNEICLRHPFLSFVEAGKPPAPGQG